MLGRLKALGVGFVLGILVAPRSGRQSRQLILDWVSEFFETGSRRLRDLEGELTRRREPVAEAEDWTAETLPEGGEGVP